jgi:RNA polymerase-binding transcription factor
MDDERARELLVAERKRLERAISRHMHEDDGEQSDPFFDSGNSAAKLYQDELDESLEEDLRVQLAALERAEERLAAGSYGLSIESGKPITDERLEVLPTAERTVEEERARAGRDKG